MVCWKKNTPDTPELFCSDEEGIELIPTQDLVRCKECKHHKDEKPGMVFCPKVVGGWVEEEGYCSWAERREM